MSSLASIQRPFRRVRSTILGVMIVALCAADGAPDALAQTPSEDLSGRWSSQKLGLVLDVSRCGAEWCGVKLNLDQSCGALALRLAPASPTGKRGELVGTLNLGDGVQAYKVSVTTMPDGAARPTEIRVLGNPNTPPQPMTRMIMFQDRLVRGSDAVCRFDGKLS